MKQKILFINNNMKIGGVQKALLEQLKALHSEYDITLFLFRKTGALMEQIPKDIRVVEATSHYRYLGMSQAECHSLCDKLVRGFYAAIAKIFGISCSLKIMSHTVRNDPLPQAPVAISYAHCGQFHSFYGGVPEYTLKHVKADTKICFIHCDYLNSGTLSRHSQSVYRNFDRIVCVSNSVKECFLKALPEMRERTVVLPNLIDRDLIQVMSACEPYMYDKNYTNLLTVARLAREKGIERVIRAMSRMEHCRCRYYILGDGPLAESLKSLVSELKLTESVFFLGEQENPYRYMLHADLLVVPSFQEAAPVVFQEAMALGLPVLSTRTLSADEMIPKEYGFVVDNTEEAILSELQFLQENPIEIQRKKNHLKNAPKQNAEDRNHFSAVICPENHEGVSNAETIRPT